jgi:large repetitive protein
VTQGVCRSLFASLVVSLLLPSASLAQMVTGSGPGDPPEVHLIESTGERVLLAYDPLFLGGVHVALGDVDGDGTADIVTGAGPGGGPHVRVFSGVDLSELASFFAFDPAFVGGVTVAAGDIDGDGRADIITGAGTGSPHVRVFSGADLSELASFFAYDTEFGGGVNVATGDVDGDGLADIITGAGIGGGPDVKAFSGANLSELASFFAFDPAFLGGVSVAAGDLDGDGFSDIIAGAGPGGGPDVRIVSGADLSELTSFFAYDPAFGGGVNVATGDLNGDGRTDLITGAGPGGGPHVRIFSGVDLSELDSFFVGTSASGVSVGSIGDKPGLRFTSATSTSFSVGIAGTFTVTAVGAATPTLTLTGTLPAGVTFVDNGDGTATLSGTPAAGTAGAHALTFTATNSSGTVTQSFTLNVNDGPVITSASTATFAIGAVNTFTVTTSGFPPPSLVQGGAALPAGVTWVDNGDGTGTLSGTPVAGTGGSYALTFTATNGSGSAVQNFTLTVSGSPAITSANTTTFTVGSAGTFTVTAVGTPTPALTVAGTLPSGVTFTDNGNGTGTLSGTPAAGTGGTYSLTFTAANGVLPDGTQAFTLNVNQAPAITSAASATFTAGTAGSFTVTTSGFPAPSLAIGGVALPAGLTFVDNGNGTGTLSGTPAAGTGGTYAITFTATNSVSASAPQAFTLTVNQAPAITSANTANFTVGQAGTFTVTTTGFPAPAIARTGAALPGGVTFVDNGNGTGTLSGTPAAGTAAAYAFTFTATNSTSPAATQAFTLNVNQPPAITSAASTTFTVGTPGTFTVTTTGFPTPTVSQTGALPTGVTFTTATRVLAGTATQTGVFPLVFTATNAIPPDATQNFTLNVVCPAITVTPLVMPDGLYQTVYAGVDFNQTGSTGTTFTWGATGLPAGLMMDANTGVVSGTATNTVLAGVVTVTVTDNFGCQGTLVTAVTIRPVAGNDPFTGGVGNTQFVVGASVATPAVVKAGNVKGNDNGPGALTVTFNAPGNGAVTEGPTDGTFIYTPNVAFGGPTETFTYTLTDGNGVTNTGTVTIALSGMVWYVNNAGGAGDGRSHNPFNTLNAAATPSAAGSQIYVHTGTGTTTGNLTMDANQTLHGAGGAFALNDLIIGAAGKPTLGGTVTIADGSLIQFVNFVTGATAISGTGTNGLTLNDVDISGSAGTGTGIALTNVSGTIDLNDVDFNSTAAGSVGLSLTNVTGATDVDSNSSFASGNGAEVLINGGTGNVTIAAPITSTAGRAIDIQNRTSGTVTFTGAISDTGGTGILLNNNGTSTFSFSAGLTLNGAATTFTATNASLTGTLTITGTNTIGATTPPTSGTALNVSNINIGASGLTFRSISANGAANGIVLDTTGSSGGLTVTGLGSTTVGGDFSGGTIQSTTNYGVSLIGTRNVSLTNIRVLNTARNGIDGRGVVNFTLANSTISNNGTANAGQFEENSLAFVDRTTPNPTGNTVSGAVSIVANTIDQPRRNGLMIETWSGTIDSLTVNSNAFTGGTTTANIQDAIHIFPQGSATTNAHLTTATITNNNISGFRFLSGVIFIGGNGIRVAGGAGSATNVAPSILGTSGQPILISGNAISNVGSNAIAFSFNGQAGSSFVNITNNGTAASPMTNMEGLGISVFFGADDFTGSSTINGNFIGTVGPTVHAGSSGIGVQLDTGPSGATSANPSGNFTVTNNSVAQPDGSAFVAIGINNAGVMDVDMRNNTVGADPFLTNRSAIRIAQNNATSPTICLQLSGNSTTGGSGVNQGIGIRRNAGLTFGVVGLPAGSTATPAFEAYINGQNPAGGGTDLISQTSGFSSCTITP